MNWHYVEQGQPAGPVSDEQFAGLVRTGKITATTLVWREGMGDWLPYQQVAPNPAGPGTGPAPAGHPGDTTTEAVCAECRKIFPMDEMIRHGEVRICANCKPVFLQKLAEGAKLDTDGMNYAGFWIRVGAKLLDGLILVVPFVVILLLVMIPMIGAAKSGQASLAPALIQLAMQLGFVAVQIGYSIFFVGKYGATPGKMICKLKVVTADGDRISYGRATGRAFAEILSRLTCSIGYIIAAFDNPQKRALHDHICNTRVIYK